MKKTVSILMAMLMVFALAAALADVTINGNNGNVEQYPGRYSNKFRVTTTGTLTETPVELIEVAWTNIDGSVSMTISGEREWDSVNHTWLTPEASLDSSSEIVLPQFGVSVTNHSSPGHDYQATLTVDMDELGGDLGTCYIDSSLTSQAASSAFGNNPATLSSALDDEENRTRSLTFSFAGLTAQDIIDDNSGLGNYLKSVTGDMAREGSVFPHYYESQAHIDITAVTSQP